MSISLLQINVDANNGSNGSIARDIGSMALLRGWKSYIAYGRRKVSCDSELIRIGNRFDIYIHGLITRLFDLHGLGSIIATRLFIRKIDKIKPDIVHLHNIHGYFINYRILFQYLVKNNIPVVWTFHDCWPFTGHCAYFEKYSCVRWKSMCYKCPAIHEYPASLFLDRSKQNFCYKKHIFTSPLNLHVTTVSSWLQQLVKESFFNKYPNQVIFDGIDTESFKPTPNNLRELYGVEKKIVLLSAAANWSASKGWNDYIELSALLPSNFVIMLVGISNEQKLIMPNNMIGVKRQESKETLAQYYTMADILLNLSYQETFGMTTAEALACGTPGISYNKTACPELLTLETGIIVEAGNLKQILQAIEEIMNNGKEFYTKACRQRALDCFDNKKVNAQFFEIYDDILNSRK